RRSSSFFFFSSRRRHTRWPRDWSSDVCSSDLIWQGVILKDLGTQGVIGIQDKQINDVANYVLTKNTGWVVAIVFTAGLAAASLRSEERRVGKEWRARWAA